MEAEKGVSPGPEVRPARRIENGYPSIPVQLHFENPIR